MPAARKKTARKTKAKAKAKEVKSNDLYITNTLTGRPMPNPRHPDYLSECRRTYWPDYPDPDNWYNNPADYAVSNRTVPTHVLDKYSAEHLKHLSRQPVTNFGPEEFTPKREPRFVLEPSVAARRVAAAKQHEKQTANPEIIEDATGMLLNGPRLHKHQHNEQSLRNPLSGDTGMGDAQMDEATGNTTLDDTSSLTFGREDGEADAQLDGMSVKGEQNAIDVAQSVLSQAGAAGGRITRSKRKNVDDKAAAPEAPFVLPPLVSSAWKLSSGPEEPEQRSKSETPDDDHDEQDEQEDEDEDEDEKEQEEEDDEDGDEDEDYMQPKTIVKKPSSPMVRKRKHLAMARALAAQKSRASEAAKNNKRKSKETSRNEEQDGEEPEAVREERLTPFERERKQDAMIRELVVAEFRASEAAERKEEALKAKKKDCEESGARSEEQLTPIERKRKNRALSRAIATAISRAQRQEREALMAEGA